MPASAAKPSCQEVGWYLASYLQGKLSLRKSQQVYAHLSRCGTCRTQAERVRTSHSSWKPGVRLFTLPAAALASVWVAPFLFQGARPAPVSPSGMVPASAGIARRERFAGQPGAGYYVRLHVPSLTAAEKAIQRILSESPVLRAKGPYAGRYYLTATPAQLNALMRRLSEVGDPGAVHVGGRRWSDDEPILPEACTAILDLLPAS